MSELLQNKHVAAGFPKSRLIGLFLGLGFLLLTLFTDPPGTMSPEAWSALGLMLIMATWWSSEAIPIPATALLPIVLVPSLGLGSISEATSSYAHPIIFLFLGGFTLGLAMQRWKLHRRIALLTLSAVGYEPKRQIAGFIMATAFLSMWVSNTATAIMMLPIALSVIAMIGKSEPQNIQRYATALLLAIAYAANIGGIATLIGTPPNALLAAYLNDTHGLSVGFAQWMLLGIPVASLMLVFTWWWLSRKDFGLGDQQNSALVIQAELAEMGQMSRGEKIVASIFVLTACAWIFRPLLSASLMPWLSDTGIAIAAAITMFMIPVNLRQQSFVLDWQSAEKLPWGILLLFGGGLAMASVISSSGLADWIATTIAATGTMSLLVLLIVIVSVLIFLTEVTSNTATAAAFLPLLGALALSQEASPLLLTVPAAIATSCAFMMPVATPPNAIVFSSGHIKISDMIQTGFVLNILGIVVVTLMSYLFMDFIFTL
ncbi:DASS family sodium-coupled anion symporter [Parahaliea sp. F7430]|uniref:DASS family sodium-coupled anion symporter n=1 Tax=Sediminihaliea albiluteola TaxID=2758564 RepID=A0A7W2TUF3_9GAMM|nr:DASS family sodium-coupled anion symporter [Sediminihaliea albiluteola]MBA6412142.1 DASS family sodium-coupled anion symporter [Sediminihaliea albiluteola]